MNRYKTLQEIESQLRAYIADVVDREHKDPTHDVLHVDRVVNWVKKLCRELNANENIAVPAAYLHDCVYIAKTDARRKQSSKISADKAMELLKEWNYPEEYFPAIHHAIMAHSFSANIKAETLEAKIVQDADRLEALGSIGIMRTFALGGIFGKPLYSVEDPFCENRKPDDTTNTLDHFYIKLLRVVDSLHTEPARKAGTIRTERLKRFMADFKEELS